MSTLIEKLKEIYDMLCCKAEDEEDECFASTYRANVDGFKWALDIVKQHSDWISVDERLPPDNMMVLVYCNIRKTTGYAFVSSQQAWSFYHFTKNSENQAMAMVNDISKWMPIPQPPSEVKP